MNGKSIHAVVALAVLLVAALPAVAEDWPAVLKTAQEKCEKQQATVRDMVVSENMTTWTDGGEMNATQTLYRRGDSMRMEMTLYNAVMGMDSIQTVVINDGKKAWMFDTVTGKREMDPDEAQQQGDFRDCWDFTPENSKIIGSDKSRDGADCYLVEMERDSVKHKLWLDKDHLRVVQGESHDADASVRWVLSDFRNVTGDYEYPYKIEMFDGDNPLSTMTVNYVKVNEGISDDTFDPDKVKIQTVNMDSLLQQMFQPAEEDSQ